MILTLHSQPKLKHEKGNGLGDCEFAQVYNTPWIFILLQIQKLVGYLPLMPFDKPKDVSLGVFS
jgi:hypothetical protein